VAPTTPADLAVDIVATGVILRTDGKNTFYKASPIPTNKTAGVKFTVTNRGGQSSGGWAFTARLPVEGDSDYKYVSPLQSPLAPGMQVEFTLGFDELLEEKTGTIRIELMPTQKTDKTANNTDSAKITIRES
jgi:hypothetical protein